LGGRPSFNGSHHVVGCRRVATSFVESWASLLSNLEMVMRDKSSQ
jgi:hypothetical protein